MLADNPPIFTVYEQQATDLEAIAKELDCKQNFLSSESESLERIFSDFNEQMSIDFENFKTDQTDCINQLQDNIEALKKKLNDLLDLRNNHPLTGKAHSANTSPVRNGFPVPAISEVASKVSDIHGYVPENMYIENVRETKEQINKLIKENMEQRSLIFQMKRDLYSLNKDHEVLKRKAGDLENRVKNPSITEVKLFFKNTNPVSGSKLGWKFLLQMIQNMLVPVNHREYTGKFTKFCHTINTQSNRTYKSFRKIFPAPARSTIDGAVASSLNGIDGKLRDFKQAGKIADNFYDHYSNILKIPEDTKIRCTLACDAIALMPEDKEHYIQSIGSAYVKKIAKEAFHYAEKFISNARYNPKKNEKNAPPLLNYMFIYYLEPLDNRFPCLPVHLLIQHGGASNSYVREMFINVTKYVNTSKHMRVVNRSTDGDYGHQKIYDDLFEELVKIAPDFNISKLLDAEFNILATGDMLHCIKVGRVRLLSNKLVIDPTNLENEVDFSRIAKILNGGKALTDLSQIGKMRDVYALEFFSLTNLITLLEKSYYDEAIAFMPFACYQEACYNRILDQKGRMFLLILAFESAIRLYRLENIPVSQYAGGVNNIRSKKTNHLTFLPLCQIKRLIVKIFSTLYLYSHNAAGEYFAFDRLGTHPLENFNGYLRVNSHFKNAIKTATSLCAKAHLLKVFEAELNMIVPHRGRVNYGGISLLYVVPILTAPNCEPHQIVESLFVLANIANNCTIFGSSPDLDNYIIGLDWISNIAAFNQNAEYRAFKFYQPSAYSGTLINMHNILSGDTMISEEYE